MKRNFALATLMIAFATAPCAAAAVPANAPKLPGAGIVMMYNVNEGTDFQQAVGATTLSQSARG